MRNASRKDTDVSGNGQSCGFHAIGLLRGEFSKREAQRPTNRVRARVAAMRREFSEKGFINYAKPNTLLDTQSLSKVAKIYSEKEQRPCSVLCFTEASAELHLPLPTGEPLPVRPGQHVKQEYDVFKLVIKPGDFNGKTKLSDFLVSQGLDSVTKVSALGTIEQLCGQQNIGNETLEKALTQILKNPTVMGLRLVDSNHFHALVPRAAATTK
jgi:hypothetical protein